VDVSSTTVGITCRDGTVLASEKSLPSKMLVPGSGRRIFAVSPRVSVAFSGVFPDARELSEVARKEAKQWMEIYDEEISAKTLAERLGLYVHAYTQYWSVRPFGCALLVGGLAKKEGAAGDLFAVDVTGLVTKYRAFALGKGRQTAKNELEKTREFGELSVEEAALLAVKTLIKAHDENDRDTEIELVVISPGGNPLNHAKLIGNEVLGALEARARELIRGEQE
jgi:20S proteasome subunit alpha 7